MNPNSFALAQYMGSQRSGGGGGGGGFLGGIGGALGGPVGIAGMGLGALANLFGGGGPSPEDLQRDFGVKRLSSDTDMLFKKLMQGQFGQSMLSSGRLGAAQAGQSLARNVGAIGGGRSSFGAALAAAAGESTRQFSDQQVSGAVGQHSLNSAQNLLLAQLAAYMQGGGGQGGGLAGLFGGAAQGLGQYSALGR